MIRIMIVDDEKHIRDELIYYLEKHSDIEICCQTGDGEEVLGLINKNEPDVVFLDIHLNTKNGLLLAGDIRKLNNPPYVVLATAYSEHALEGFDVGAIDYLVKPFDNNRIDQCMNRIKSLIKLIPEQSKEEYSKRDFKKIALQKNGKFSLVDIGSIVYLESINNLLYIYTSDNQYIANNLNLKGFVEVYGALGFIRIHKSFIVNVEYISEIVPWFNSTMKIILKNNEMNELFVSRSYIKIFKEILKIQ